MVRGNIFISSIGVLARKFRVLQEVWILPVWEGAGVASIPIWALDITVLILKLCSTCIMAIVKVFIPPVMKNLYGETVLITGAGHGIGRELAIQLADLGATVICWDNDARSNNAVVNEIRSKDGECFGYTVDVTARDQVAALATRMSRELTEVSMVISNAGYFSYAPITQLKPEAIAKMVETNLLAHLWIFQVFLPSMIERRYGHIIAINSCAGLMPFADMVPYCAAKFGLRDQYGIGGKYFPDWTPIASVCNLQKQRLIPMEKLCTRHHRPMTLRSDVGQVSQFRCRKSQCRTKPIFRAVGTRFENARLSITLIFQLMYAFSQNLSYHQARLECADEENPVLSEATVSDWYSYCRETIVVYALEHQEYNTKIGGPNKVVQIDESKFGKRKYNRGRQIEGHWVIGMIEDGSDDLRLEVCPDNQRSSEILVPLIKKHVQEGFTIHTDYWRAYLALPEHGYTHKRVNHSDPLNRFVAPDGTHTQRIESQWRGIKKEFRREHNKKDFADWLIEYSWRRKIRIENKDPFEELIKAIMFII